MTFVVIDNCIRCKYMDCVEVCPVDCFREGPNMLVIDPNECIDCNLCVPECPVHAIFAGISFRAPSVSTPPSGEFGAGDAPCLPRIDSIQ